jgi:hypothetical protein
MGAVSTLCLRGEAAHLLLVLLAPLDGIPCINKGIVDLFTTLLIVKSGYVEEGLELPLRRGVVDSYSVVYFFGYPYFSLMFRCFCSHLSLHTIVFLLSWLATLGSSVSWHTCRRYGPSVFGV